MESIPQREAEFKEESDKKLESVLLEWFKESHASNILANIELLRQKAVHL